MRLFLVGLAGSGKSTLGRQLAKVVGYTLIDLDDAISQHEGSSIPQIFENKGEEHFRATEAGVLRQVCAKHKDLIIATGGGAPCHHDNMAYMIQHGKAIYLNVPVEVLAKRVKADGIDSRPLYKGLDDEALRNKIMGQLRDREIYYKQAQLLVSGDAISVEEIISQIS